MSWKEMVIREGAKDCKDDDRDYVRSSSSHTIAITSPLPLTDGASSDEKEDFKRKIEHGASPAEKEDFKEEIGFMLDLGEHPNILHVYACCTLTEPCYMITELLKYGDLLGFLRKCNKEEMIDGDRNYEISDLQRYQIASQIADGMSFISSKRLYHGDLAARNILVGTGLAVKISDFGLARDLYEQNYKRLTGGMTWPVKWASLETNLEGKCTTQSDVWSYGIVLYEIFTNGLTPYHDMDQNVVVRWLQAGHRLQKPESCPDHVYSTMQRCWDPRPGYRPSFPELQAFFDGKIADPRSRAELTKSEIKSADSTSVFGSCMQCCLVTPRRSSTHDKESGARSGESADMEDWRFYREEEQNTASDGRHTERSGEGSGSPSGTFDANGGVFVRQGDADKSM